MLSTGFSPTFIHAKKPAAASSALSQPVADLMQALSQLYPNQNVAQLTQLIQAKAARYASPTETSRVGDWYKDEVIYRIYPDAITHQGKQDFSTLTKILPQLKQLGVTTLYILPFLESPMGDGGFDVSDFMKVRQSLGGTAGFDAFAKAAKAQGFKLKADLVLNHVSEQHPWFQDLIKLGQHADKFHVRSQYPVVKREIVNNKVIVHYQEPDGSISPRMVIMTHAVDNHYRSVTINRQPAWVYSSFYPFQIDINWDNPEVMLHMLDVVGMWAKKGVDIFRLDGFNYLIKKPGHNGQSHPLNQSVVKLINAYLKMVKPDGALLAEVEGDVDKQTLTRYFSDGGVHLTYAFPAAAALWDGLLSERAEPVIKAVQSMPKLPSHGQWIGFLRNHDELMLGNYLSPEKTKDLLGKLDPQTPVFRENMAVGGRMANLLNRHPQRLAMAQALLLSLPMTPELYYGDEWGLENNPAFAQAQAKRRKAMGVDGNALDARDFNRGPVTLDTFLAQENNPVRQQVRQWIDLRKKSIALRRGTFEPIPVKHPGVVAFKRVTANLETVAVYHNLTSKIVPLDHPVQDAITGKRLAELKPYQSVAQVDAVRPAQWHLPQTARHA